MKKVNAREKAKCRKFIAAEIEKLISNDQLPAGRYEEYISDALKDESILKVWRALPPKPPGVPPLNLPPATKVPEAIHNKNTSKAFEKFFLKDWWNSSFYDEGVQAVLEEIHQSHLPSGHTLTDEQLANAIRAWKVCNNAVMCQMRPPSNEKLIDFLRDTVSWGGRLLVAIQQYYERGGRRTRQPKTLADLFLNWADSRYFESSSVFRPQDPPHKYAEAVDEIQKGFSKIIQENQLSITEGALRKYVSVENSRRKRLKEHWRKNWEAYKLCEFNELLGQAIVSAQKNLEGSGK
jgi:hypothetical protein